MFFYSKNTTENKQQQWKILLNVKVNTKLISDTDCFNPGQRLTKQARKW